MTNGAPTATGLLHVLAVCSLAVLSTSCGKKEQTPAEFLQWSTGAVRRLPGWHARIVQQDYYANGLKIGEPRTIEAWHRQDGSTKLVFMEGPARRTSIKNSKWSLSFSDDSLYGAVDGAHRPIGGRWTPSGFTNFGQEVFPDGKSLKFGPDEIVEGVACRTIEWTNSLVFTGEKLAISKKTGLVMRREVLYLPGVPDSFGPPLSKQQLLIARMVDTYEGLIIGTQPDSAFELEGELRRIPSASSNTYAGNQWKGQRVPGYWIRDANWKGIPSSSFTGDTVVFYFLSSHSALNRYLLEDAKRLADKYKGRPVRVLPVIVEADADPKSLAKEHKAALPIYANGEGQAGIVYAIKQNSTPAVAVIDGNGLLVQQTPNYPDPELVNAAVEEALTGKLQEVTLRQLSQRTTAQPAGKQLKSTK